jgi:predicted dithiol-disulfide oxidoreductase (DUF899 family)
MTEYTVGTREEWLAARKELLEREKELTRNSDELARQRQELPWVRVEKEYSFETDEGTRTLAELFGGRSQLLFITSCSAGGCGSPTTRRGAQVVRSWRTTSTAPFHTSMLAT